MKNKKYYLGSLLIAILFVSGLFLQSNAVEAGAFNRKGTWKKQFEESVGGKVLTTYDQCKWSLWKSECSSAGEGDKRNEEVFTLL